MGNTNQQPVTAKDGGRSRSPFGGGTSHAEKGARISERRREPVVSLIKSQVVDDVAKWQVSISS